MGRTDRETPGESLENEKKKSEGAERDGNTSHPRRNLKKEKEKRDREKKHR